MPNWCSTCFIFHGTDEEIKLLNDKIIEWTTQSYRQTDFGSDWLGNILIGAGLGDTIDNSDPDIRISCRGYITDFSLDKPINSPRKLYVYTETAWVPMAKMWDRVIKTLNLTSVGFEYEATELGCSLYQIYDPHEYGTFIDRVCIDAYSEQNDICGNLSGYYTEQEALKTMRDFFEDETASRDEIEELCEDFSERHNYNSYIAIHYFERIDDIYD